jgi:magnesium-transporting ATPase (P-type)
LADKIPHHPFAVEGFGCCSCIGSNETCTLSLNRLTARGILFTG